MAELAGFVVVVVFAVAEVVVGLVVVVVDAGFLALVLVGVDCAGVDWACDIATKPNERIIASSIFFIREQYLWG